MGQILILKIKNKLYFLIVYFLLLDNLCLVQLYNKDSITKLIDKVQNEIVSIEEEVIIEPKPKVKNIVKKSINLLLL